MSEIAKSSTEELLKPKIKGLSLNDQKAIDVVAKLSPEDQAAAFFNLYGAKFVSILDKTSAKQIRRALVHALGMPRPGYKPKSGSDEAFILFAIEKLLEIKTAMQLEVMYNKLGDAEKEFIKESNLEDVLIDSEVKRLEEKQTSNDNAELSAYIKQGE